MLTERKILTLFFSLQQKTSITGFELDFFFAFSLSIDTRAKS